MSEKPSDLGAARRASLLELARAAISARLDRRDSPRLPADGHDPRGVFVSLHTGAGALRGCVGCFRGEGPLERTVARMALESAFQDPRFPPLSAMELDDLELEISVLGPMEKISGAEDLEMGCHGAAVERGGHRGVLLPQVALDHDWDAETFLDQVCIKAGLEPGDWRLSGTRLERFTADVFSEAPGGTGAL